MYSINVMTFNICLVVICYRNSFFNDIDKNRSELNPRIIFFCILYFVAFLINELDFLSDIICMYKKSACIRGRGDSQYTRVLRYWINRELLPSEVGKLGVGDVVYFISQ